MSHGYFFCKNASSMCHHLTIKKENTVSVDFPKTPVNIWKRKIPVLVILDSGSPSSNQQGLGSWVLWQLAGLFSGWWVCPGWRFQSLSSRRPPAESRTCQTGVWTHLEKNEGNLDPIPKKKKGTSVCRNESQCRNSWSNYPGIIQRLNQAILQLASFSSFISIM